MTKSNKSALFFCRIFSALHSIEKVVKNKIIRTIFGAGLIAIASSASAEDSGRSVWEAIVDTLPAGMVSEENSSGSYLSDTWVGMKTIISEGSSGLLLPAYTIHPGYAYKTEKRHNENGYTWGGGISRNFIDSRGNRRIMYAMAFSDSHNNFEPFMGYGWLSRWRLGSTPFYAEAGYTIGLTARGDYKWIPFPALLPLLGVGTDNFSIYGTYVPFSDIFFFFANMTFDDRKSRHMPDTPKSLFSNKVLIYAGGGWQKTTLKGTPKPSSISSDGAYSAGLRYFVTPDWALDFSVNRSGTHSIHANGSKVGSYKLTSYSLAVQYHFRAAERVKLYAGVGAGYFRSDQQDFKEGWGAKKDIFTPVIQAGGTVAVTRNLHVTGGMDLGFPRYKAHSPTDDSFSMRPSPVTFKLALGLAF